MEQQLKALFLEKELRLLGISPSCLPIQTGPLPQSPYFSDLPSLKRLLIENSLCHLYRSFANPLKVIIFTWVIGDGLGDFSAQIETAKTLSLRLPLKSQITLVSLHPRRLPLPSLPLDLPHFSIPYEEDEKELGLKIPPVHFPENLITLLKTADVILQIPTYFPWTKQLLAKVLHQKGPSYELIGEGGWSTTPRFSPLTTSRSLGLHFWEKGLFFPDLEKKTSFQNLTSPFLKSILSTHKPQEKLCLAYLRNHTLAEKLLLSLLKQTEKDTSSLSLCLFPCEGLISQIPSLTEPLRFFGIREVHVFYENHFSKVPIAHQGKTLKIIQVKKLPRSDYHILLQASNTLTGCRGDGSLAETLSAGKIPFLDFPSHKKPLLEGLLSIASYFLSKNHEVYQYLIEFLKETLDIEKIGSLAANPKTQEGFTKLSILLKKHYKADDFITNLTLRAGCHHLYPHLALFEKISLAPFLEGERGAFDTLKEIQAEIIQAKI